MAPFESRPHVALLGIGNEPANDTAPLQLQYVRGVGELVGVEALRLADLPAGMPTYVVMEDSSRLWCTDVAKVVLAALHLRFVCGDLVAADQLAVVAPRVRALHHIVGALRDLSRAHAVFSRTAAHVQLR